MSRIDPIGPEPPPLKLDAQDRGVISATVPDGWTPAGWLLSMRDRIMRTDVHETRERLRQAIAELKGKI